MIKDKFKKFLGSTTMFIAPIMTPVRPSVIKSDTVKQISDIPVSVTPDTFLGTVMIIGFLLLIIIAILSFSKRD
jgi:hypothetical protein